MLVYWWRVGPSVYVAWPMRKKKTPANLTGTPRRHPTPTSSVSCSRNGVDQFTVWHALVTVSFFIQVFMYFWSRISSIRQEMGRHTKTRAQLYHSFGSGCTKEAAGISLFVSLRPKSQCSLANRHLFVWFKFYFLPKAINALGFNWDLENFCCVLWNPMV